MPVPHSDTLGVRQPNAKVAAGGFEQCHNAQAVVAAGSLLVAAGDVVQAPNDKQQVQPMLEALAALPEALGKAEILLANTGYFSEANVDACAAAGIDPLIAGPAEPLPAAFGTHHRRSAGAGKTDPGRGDGSPPANQSWQGPLCAAQADTGAGVRDHQIGDRLPAIFVARLGQRSGRMETRDHGLEHQETIHPRSRGLRENRALPAQSGAPAAGQRTKKSTNPRSTRYRHHPPSTNAGLTPSQAARSANRPPTHSDRLLADTE
jgi:hypothetical protein